MEILVIAIIGALLIASLIYAIDRYQLHLKKQKCKKEHKEIYFLSFEEDWGEHDPY